MASNDSNPGSNGKGQLGWVIYERDDYNARSFFHNGGVISYNVGMK